MDRANVIRCVAATLAERSPDHWWEADSADEVAVGAVLTQQTSWENVKKAIGNLRKEGLLSLEAIAGACTDKIENAIRPAGFYRVKARRLVALANALLPVGCVKGLYHMDIREARRFLLSINGVGPETADSILLYGAGLPVLVVDAYTHRILTRVLGLPEQRFDYAALQQQITGSLKAADVSYYRRLHAGFVELAKSCCKTRPSCTDCVLDVLCRHNGASALGRIVREVRHGTPEEDKKTCIKAQSKEGEPA
ncbi:MAG: endonuclease [Bacillota bacterium]